MSSLFLNNMLKVWNKSVLENMSTALTFELMKRPNCNIGQGLKPSDRLSMRKLIVEAILSTDMAGHCEFTTKLKTHLTDDHFIREAIGRCTLPTSLNFSFIGGFESGYKKYADASTYSPCTTMLTDPVKRADGGLRPSTSTHRVLCTMRQYRNHASTRAMHDSPLCLAGGDHCRTS